MDNEINEMIERVLIQRNKTVDDMILGEIRKIATENGIDTIITLNDKAIIQALKNFAEVKQIETVRDDLKWWLETNTEKGVVYIPEFVVENMIAKMDGGKAE